MAKKSKKNTSSTAENTSSGNAVATAPRPATKKGSNGDIATPTYEQITQRAQEIWMKNGCLPGQDEQNWLLAERQLMAELTGK